MVGNHVTDHFQLDAYGFTEEYDVAQRQVRANIRQAFVHAALLETAVRLMPSVPDGDVLDRSPGWG